MLIFDAHLDLAWNALEYNRDLTRPVAEIREFEAAFDHAVPGPNTVAFPDMRRGGVGIAIATLLPRLHRRDVPRTHYQSREASHAACMGQLAYYRAMEARGVLRLIPDRAALDSHLADLQTGPRSDTPLGIILGMEGSPGILEPKAVHDWHALGLRVLGPAHYGENPYCFGTGSEGGLKLVGRELFQEMNRAGLVLDATHLADRSFWEALEIFDGPVIASHHNCRALIPGDRQLTDEQIEALAARGAVIGLALDDWMLHPGWKRGVSKAAEVSLEDAVNHTDHICQLLGTSRHCGIGSDLDGGFGKEQSPGDLDTIADLARIAEILERRGYSADDVSGIMHGNYVGVFRRAWSGDGG
ncbi:MAG: membrane dipeptidase [Planctomycetaceae bacterium]